MLTAEQQELRRSGLGASELPAVLGLDPYCTPFDVYAVKRGIVPPDPGNIHTRLGDLLEPVILTLYGEDRQVSTYRNAESFRHPSESWLFATPDAFGSPPGMTSRPSLGHPDAWLIEAKYRGYWNRQGWGEVGSDEVPDSVAVQVHTQLAVTGFAYADVAAFLGDFRWYRIHADPMIAANILEMGRDFWVTNVLGGVHPKTVPQDSERLGRLLRQSTEGLRPASDDIEALLDELLGVRAELKRLEQVRDGLQAAAKSFIADAAGIQSRVANCTWKTAKASKKTDWEAIGALLLERLRQADVNEAAALLAQHTQDVPGSRRFLISAKGV